MNQKLFAAAVTVSRVLAESGINHPSIDALRAVLRSSESAVEYTGHAPGSGIQKHSIGDLFPWDVIAVGDLQPTEWCAKNHNTGQQGPRRATIAQATADVHEYVQRAKIVAAIQSRGITDWADVACDPGVRGERRVAQRRQRFQRFQEGLRGAKRVAFKDRRETLHSSERNSRSEHGAVCDVLHADLGQRIQ